MAKRFIYIHTNTYEAEDGTELKCRYSEVHDMGTGGEFDPLFGEERWFLNDEEIEDSDIPAEFSDIALVLACTAPISALPVEQRQRIDFNMEPVV